MLTTRRRTRGIEFNVEGVEVVESECLVAESANHIARRGPLAPRHINKTNNAAVSGVERDIEEPTRELVLIERHAVVGLWRRFDRLDAFNSSKNIVNKVPRIAVRVSAVERIEERALLGPTLLQK